MQSDDRFSEADIVARTLYAEAEGEGLLGVEAVVSVILNRAAAAKEYPGTVWGKTPAEVCLRPFQFGCWNPKSASFQRVMHLNPSDPFYRLCRRTAGRALRGFVSDSVNGATHFHRKDVSPAWARRLIPVAEIGRLLFYREVF